MKPLLTAFAMAALGAMPAAGQRSWTPEIGIQGGFARAKPAGTGAHDHVDLWDVPGDGARYASLFVIVPVTARFAIEPSVSASQSSLGEVSGLLPFVSGSIVRLTVRSNLAVSAKFYAAAGATAQYLEAGGAHDTQLGFVAAVGYRRRLRTGLTIRLEAQGSLLRRSDSIAPANVYALLLGVSRRTRRPAASVDRDSQPAGRHWRLAFGMAGGYARTHLYGSVFGFQVTADQATIALPGSGTTTPTTLYAIVPLRGRFALEAGFDAHRSQGEGSTFFDAQLAPRLNIALRDGWYAAGGGNMRYLKQTGSAGFAFAGAHVAVGYRFPLVEELGGRVEISYSAFKERENFPLAQNTLAIMFGVAMARY